MYHSFFHISQVFDLRIQIHIDKWLGESPEPTTCLRLKLKKYYYTI